MWRTRSRRSSTSSAAQPPPPRLTPAAAAISSGSNGSPATAAPSRTSRTSSESRRELLGERGSTAGGTSQRRAGGPRRGRAPGHTFQRARELLQRRTGCRRSPRGTPPAAAPRRRIRAAAGSRAGSELRARDGSAFRLRCARSNAAARRSGTWRGRMRHREQHRRCRRRRRSSAPSSSTVPESAQCRSSRISTSGLRRRERLQQVAKRAVGAVALVLKRRLAAGAEPGQRGEDVARARASVCVQLLQAPRVEPLDVLVERVDEDPERQVALELGRGAGEHQLPARVGASARARRAGGSCRCRARQPARRPRRPPCSSPVEGLIERVELRGAPDELLGRLGHVRLLGRRDVATARARTRSSHRRARSTARELDAGRDVELAEHVPDVRLDGLRG